MLTACSLGFGLHSIAFYLGTCISSILTCTLSMYFRVAGNGCGEQQPRFYAETHLKHVEGWRGPREMSHPCFTLCKCAAVLTYLLGCKDTLVPMLCLGCLPLVEVRVLQPLTQLWKLAPFTGDSPLQCFLLLHLPVLHILIGANTYHSSAGCALENILTGD